MTINAKHTATLAAAAALPAPACAQGAFPNKPVTLMVPYPAGGLSDVIARTVNTKRVAAHLAHLPIRTATRYELPALGALNFVLEGAFAGGVTRSLALDARAALTVRQWHAPGLDRLVRTVTSFGDYVFLFCIAVIQPPLTR